MNLQADLGRHMDRNSYLWLLRREITFTTADLMNNRVTPFYYAHWIALLRVVTDRGAEHCSTVKNRAHQLYRAFKAIEQCGTKANSPQTNDVCEWLHRMIKDEFYDIAFFRKLYRSLEELRTDLNHWLKKYNEQRPQSGRY
ncbi:MAG: integrase core domain-containing protein [Pseudomonadota bacterium]